MAKFESCLFSSMKYHVENITCSNQAVLVRVPSNVQLRALAIPLGHYAQTEGGIFDPTVYRGGLQTKFISSLDIAYIKFRPKNDQTEAQHQSLIIFCIFSSTFKKSADPNKQKIKKIIKKTIKIHFSSIIDEVISWRNPILIFPELIYIEKS